jgi:hypothetical protein
MTLNACKLKMRERSRRPDQEFIEDKDPKTLKVLSIAAYREERLDESLHDALDSLPEVYRQVLTLYYLGGMSGKEIALFLRVSPATVRQRLGRARSRLKKEMHSMMSTEFEDRKLQATFTFRIVEAVKRIKIHPMPRTTGIPWGFSLAVGIIAAVLSLSPHLNILSPVSPPSGSRLPSQMKVLKTGEVSVDVLEIANRHYWK